MANWLNPAANEQDLAEAIATLMARRNRSADAKERAQLTGLIDALVGALVERIQ